MKTCIAARTTALALAVSATLSLLGSVDYLATTEPAPQAVAAAAAPRV